MNHDSRQPDGAAPDSRAAAPRGRRLPGPWAGAILIICVVAIALLQPVGPVVNLSRADTNIAVLVLGLVALATLLVWFLRYSAYPARLRHATGWSLLGVGVALVVLFRIDHVSGDLVPSLAFRWHRAADRALQRPDALAAEVDLSATTEKDFPEFLGPNRQNDLPHLMLERDWQTHPPRQLWEVSVGAGWSGFSIVNGYAVTMEQRGDEELVTCLDIADGRVQWFHAVEARHETLLGGVGPRSTTTIYDGKVYALGATGILRCLDGATGREIWTDNILARTGVSPQEDIQGIAWGRAASPLVVGDLVVVPWGGPAGGPYVSLAAYDRHDGRLVWTAGEYQASFSSPTLATIDGTPQILIVNQDYVTGHDAVSGEVLWQCPWPGSSSSSANVSQPVLLPPDRVLLSKGYGGGAKVVRVIHAGDGAWRVEEVWASSRLLQTKFTNVVVRGDYAYGLSDGILECIDVVAGRRQWKGGRYGQGQVLGVGDALLVQAESGDVVLVAARPDRHDEIARFPALAGKTWNNPSLFGNRLLVRNAETAACYELVLGDS